MSKLFVAMVAMATCVGFVACDDNTQNGEEINLAGNWFTLNEGFQELLMIAEDHSIISHGADDTDIWLGIEGHITLDGNRFEMIFEDDDNTSGTYTLEGNKFTIFNDDGESLVYTKLEKELSVAGEWAFSESRCFIRAIADEVVLPSGSTVDGEVIPTTIPTSQIKGEFIENAVLKYLKNINFDSEGKLNYTVNYNNADSNVTKNYTINNNFITISGESGGLEHTSTFMIFQNVDKSKIFLLMTKETMADMFVGYAHMLRQSGASSGSEEALEAFRQSFLNAFANYAVIITLDRQ